MEINFKDISSDYELITKEYILSKITPKQIVEYYLNLDLKFISLINSPFRKDNNPSFGLKLINDYDVLGTDFANDEHYDCFSIVSKLNGNCSFTETLKIIANDFGLYKFKLAKSEIPLVINTSDIIPVKNHTSLKKVFTIEEQVYTKYDLKYWGQYRIQLSTLLEYNVLSCKRLWVNGQLLKTYSSANPVYAYQFNSGIYKIYSPLADKKHKWLFNGSSTDIEGFDQLPLSNEILIITKSLKDVMCLYEHGYSAISLQGEGNTLSSELYNKLTRRFDNIYSLYDFDNAGIKGAEKLFNDYNIKPLFIPSKTSCKDFAEFCINHTETQSKNLIRKLLNKANVS